MKLVPIILSASLLVACNKTTEQTQSDVQHVKPFQVKQQGTLVQVNDTVITELELDNALARITANMPIPPTQELKDKVLDSLIASRAMALLAQQQLDDTELKQLDIKTQAYREELLVKQYLLANANPQPVSVEMVKQYYQNNPQEFGGTSIKGFEYIASYKAMDDGQTKQLIAALNSVNKSTDYAALANKLQQAKLPVQYKKAEINVALLDTPIKELVSNTLKGNTAPLYKNEQQVVLLRVLSERTTPAKPLAEVSGDIRKRLAPIQLRNAVKGLTEKAKKQVVIKQLH